MGNRYASGGYNYNCYTNSPCYSKCGLTFDKTPFRGNEYLTVDYDGCESDHCPIKFDRNKFYSDDPYMKERLAKGSKISFTLKYYL